MKKDNYSLKQENINVKLLIIEENGEIKDFKSCLPKFKFEDVAKYVIAKELEKNKKKSK